MLTDHHVAAAVAFDLQQLRKKSGREDTGISPLAAMSQPNDMIGMLKVKVYQSRHALPLQQRLIRHLKQQGVAVAQCLDTQPYRVALAVFRMAVGNWCKVIFLCEFNDFRILCHHHGGRQPVCRDRIQRVVDQAFAVPFQRQLIAAEPGAHSGRHDNAADTHGNHSFPDTFHLLVVYPVS